MVVIEEVPMEVEEVRSKLVQKSKKKVKEAKTPKAPSAALERIRSSQKLAKAKKEADSGVKRGVVFVQHLPHGFFEDELLSFFSQFGRVYRTKLFRSKKTGRSKGYAFVEFAVEEVARIAAEAMNNYLMFNKLIKCRVLEDVKNTHLLFGNIVTADEPREFREASRQRHYEIGPGITKREYMEKRLVELTTVKEKLSALGVDWSFEAIEKPFRAELEQIVVKKDGDGTLKKIKKQPLKAKGKFDGKAKNAKKDNKSQLKKAAVAEEMAASIVTKVSTPKTPITEAVVMPASKKTPLSTPRGKSPKSTPTNGKEAKTPVAALTPKPTTPATKESVTPKNAFAILAHVEKTPKGKSPALSKVETPLSKKSPAPHQAKSTPASTPMAPTPVKAVTPTAVTTPKLGQQKTPKVDTPVQKLQTPQKTSAKAVTPTAVTTPKLGKQKTPKVDTPVQKLQTPQKTSAKAVTPSVTTTPKLGKQKTPKVDTPVQKLQTPQKAATKADTPKVTTTPKVVKQKAPTTDEKSQTPKKTSTNIETLVSAKPEKVQTPKAEPLTPKKATGASTPAENEQPARKKKKSLPKVSPKMLRSRAKQDLVSTPVPEKTATPAKTPKQKRVQEPKVAVENSETETPAKRRKSMFAGSKPSDSPAPYPKFSPKMLRSRGNATPSGTASPAVKSKGRKSVI